MVIKKINRLELGQKIHFMLIGIIIVLFHISDLLKIPENEEVDSWKKVSTSGHTHTHIIVFSIYSIIKQNMSSRKQGKNNLLEKYYMVEA